jgi:hypothetical protein
MLNQLIMNQVALLNKVSLLCLCVVVCGTSFSQSSTTLLFDASIHTESCVISLRPALNNGTPAALVLTARTNVDDNDALSLNAAGHAGKLVPNSDGWGVKDPGVSDGCAGSGGISGGGGDKDEEITITFDALQLASDVSLLIGNLDFNQDQPVVFVSTASSPDAIVLDYAALQNLETTTGTLELGLSSQLTSVTDISSITLRETDGHTYLSGIVFVDSNDDDGDDDDVCPEGDSYCGVGTTWDTETATCVCLTSCYADLNLDGFIQLNDLLDLLSVYGTHCD